jgi:hypothetical protein
MKAHTFNVVVGVVRKKLSVKVHQQMIRPVANYLHFYYFRFP